MRKLIAKRSSKEQSRTKEQIKLTGSLILINRTLSIVHTKPVPMPPRKKKRYFFFVPETRTWELPNKCASRSAIHRIPSRHASLLHKRIAAKTFSRCHISSVIPKQDGLSAVYYYKYVHWNSRTHMKHFTSRGLSQSVVFALFPS